MAEYCDYCGTQLRTSNGKKFCPNHGLVQGEETSIQDSPGYV